MRYDGATQKGAALKAKYVFCSKRNKKKRFKAKLSRLMRPSIDRVCVEKKGLVIYIDSNSRRRRSGQRQRGAFFFDAAAAEKPQRRSLLLLLRKRKVRSRRIIKKLWSSPLKKIRFFSIETCVFDKHSCES
jgi:hypothetical protein